MITEEEYMSANKMFLAGKSPSEILRFIAKGRRDISPPDLMDVAQRTFEMERSDVRCIGGWSPDGNAELSDAQLDKFLIRSAKRVR